MPIVREDSLASGLDEEDRRKYHYQPSAKGKNCCECYRKSHRCRRSRERVAIEDRPKRERIYAG